MVIIETYRMQTHIHSQTSASARARVHAIWFHTHSTESMNEEEEIKPFGFKPYGKYCVCLFFSLCVFRTLLYFMLDTLNSLSFPKKCPPISIRLSIIFFICPSNRSPIWRHTPTHTCKHTLAPTLYTIQCIASLSFSQHSRNKLLCLL